MVSFGDKDLIFIYLNLFSLIIFHIILLDLLEEMNMNSQLAEKIMNIHQSKLDVVNFDGINNFEIWRCEVMDALTISNLENTLLFGEKAGG